MSDGNRRSAITPSRPNLSWRSSWPSGHKRAARALPWLVASDQVTASARPEVDLARVLTDTNFQYFARGESSGCLDGRACGGGVCATADPVGMTDLGQQVADIDLVGWQQRKLTGSSFIVRDR